MLIYPCLDKAGLSDLENRPIIDLITFKSTLSRNSEREQAHYWYDTTENKIKDKLNRTWTEKIGDKTFTFKAANQRFFEPELRKDMLGEEVSSETNPNSFTQKNEVADYYGEMLRANQESGITSGSLGE
jgi:hypothetical protein